MLALYADEEVERASRCHSHQQKVIANRQEFDTCSLGSTSEELWNSRAIGCDGDGTSINYCFWIKHQWGIGLSLS